MRTYSEVRGELLNGSLSCYKLVEQYLKNIELHKDLNAFREVYQQEALDRAKQVDEKLKNGTAGKLAGMVVGLKDVLCHTDHELTASSKILDGFQSQFNATVVERLLKEDAIIIGRQNCDEFAMGSSNENSAYGAVKNADDVNRVPGGSSGGSAVAVQADMCMVSLGTDTGGSVRQPASFCGVIGLKPTYSRVSRHGLLAYASSFDVIGVFSKSVDDCALTLEVISGPDDFDSTVSTQEVPSYSKGHVFEKPLKIAYFKEALDEKGVSNEVCQALQAEINKLKSAGHEVDELEFPLLDYVLPTYYILTTAEASSNLSRFDGVKYGYRNRSEDSLERMYKLTRSEAFGQEVKRRIMLGTFVLSASYYDAFYTKAQKVRREIRDKTRALLQEYDFIVMPTSPTTAFKLGEHTANPLEMYLADLFTVQASVAGVPAISVPIDRDANGMSIGMQIMSDSFKENELLSFSKYILEH